jgi:hypothetical protein
MTAGDPIVLALSQAEHALYLSGIKRGHSEALKQIASQLREAGKSSRDRTSHLSLKSRKDLLLDALSKVLDGYEAIATQLDNPAMAAHEEQAKLLDRYQQQREPPPRSIIDRTRAAALGALGGWLGK